MFSSSLLLLAIGAAALLCEATTAPSSSSSLGNPREAHLAGRQATLAASSLVKEEQFPLHVASRQGKIVCPEDQSLNGQLYCMCSPTGGSGSKDAKQFLDRKAAEVTEFYERETAKGEFDISIILATATELLMQAMSQCVEKFGPVSCHDAEASERVLGDTNSGSVYCKWNVRTGANLSIESTFELTDVCGFQPPLFELSVCEGSSVSSSGETEGSENAGGATEGNDENGSNADGSKEIGNESAGGSSEGCVDVRALPPCRRIHAHDITAEVLCTRGLCATPNHELVVDGLRTSMGVLCKSTACTHMKMLVNTCYYRDLVDDGQFMHAASGIGVTSWDVRFPRLAIILLQDLLMTTRMMVRYFSDGVQSEL